MTVRELLRKILDMNVPLDTGIVRFREDKLEVLVSKDGQMLSYLIE